MPKCEMCGNDYDKAFLVTMDGKAYTFDSFECAIKTLAPTIPQPFRNWSGRVNILNESRGDEDGKHTRQRVR